jgi:hypothetical protein
MLAGMAALFGGGGLLAIILQQRAARNIGPAMKKQFSQPKSTGERRAELLAKGQLSPQEMEEFVRLQNQRILEPQDGEFVSKHSFPQTDMATRLKAIDWFAHCGEPLKLDLTTPAEKLADWAEANKSCNGHQWKNTTLAAQNQLSGWLHVHAKAEFQKWNDHVAVFKALMKPISESIWEPYVRQHNLDKDVISDLSWNVLGAMMENVYLDQQHHCFFSLELFSVYEAGHFPCGWIGEWPQRKLLVY